MDSRVAPTLKTNTMKNIYKRIIVVLLFVISNLVQAQVTPSPPGFGDDVNDVPISSEMWMNGLLVVAILFGSYYAYQKAKLQTQK